MLALSLILQMNMSSIYANPNSNNVLISNVEKHASDWAKEEIKEAIDKGLYTERLVKANFKSSISREEFTELLMLVYKKFDSSFKDTSKKSPFTDTLNKAVINAYTLKLVNGKSKTLFDARGNLTRQEFSTMMHRMLKLAFLKNHHKIDMKSVYEDSKDKIKDINTIANWANDAMLFFYENSIMKGSNSKLNPNGTLTKEMAILMTLRTYKQFYALIKDVQNLDRNTMSNPNTIMLYEAIRHAKDNYSELDNIPDVHSLTNEFGTYNIEMPEIMILLTKKENSEKYTIFESNGIRLSVIDKSPELDNKDLEKFIRNRYSEGSVFYDEISGKKGAISEFEFKKTKKEESNQSLDRIIANISIKRESPKENINVKVAILREKSNTVGILIEKITDSSKLGSKADKAIDNVLENMFKRTTIPLG